MTFLTLLTDEHSIEDVYFLAIYATSVSDGSLNGLVEVPWVIMDWTVKYFLNRAGMQWSKPQGPVALSGQIGWCNYQMDSPYQDEG